MMTFDELERQVRDLRVVSYSSGDPIPDTIANLIEQAMADAVTAGRDQAEMAAEVLDELADLAQRVARRVRGETL